MGWITVSNYFRQNAIDHVARYVTNYFHGTGVTSTDVHECDVFDNVS